MPKVIDHTIRVLTVDLAQIAEQLAVAIPVRLQQELHRRGWSSEDLAAKCGVQAPTIRGWLRGEYLPSLDRLAAVADALGVSRGWLAYGG